MLSSRVQRNYFKFATTLMQLRTAIIVLDASILINFLRIARMDLSAGHSHGFIATDHVAAKISKQFPDQQERLV